MNSNTRHRVSGPFLVRDLGRGAWRVTRTVPPDVDILLQGAEPAAARVLSSATGLSLEWRAAEVILTLSSAAGDSCLGTRAAIVHEPQARLYEGLPLENFDAAAARFWRRIFRMVRFPGGRYFLRFLARRNTRSGS